MAKKKGKRTSWEIIKNKKGKHKPEFWLLLIVLFALALRLYFFVGPNMNDDMEYVFSSHSVSRGDFSPLSSSSIDSIRSMMILPIAFFFFLFGAGEFAASLYILLTSMLAIVLTFLVGRILFSYKTALAAAFILAIFPLDIAFSTQLVPSVPMTLFLMTSILFFLMAERKKHNPEIYYALSGIFAGISYLTSELFFLAGFFFLPYFILKRKLRREYILLAIGFLIVFSIESIFMFLKTGDMFHRLDVIHEEELRVLTNTDLMYYTRAMFDFINPDYNAHEGNLGIFIYLYIAASLFAVYKRNWKAILLSLFVFISLMYLEFGIMTSTFKPIAKWVRYLVVFGPALSLLTAYFFAEISKRKFLLPELLVFAFAVSLPYTAGATATYNMWVSDFRAEYNYLKNLTEKPIFTDSGSHDYIALYFNFERRINLLEDSTLESVRDSYVIIDGSFGIVTYQPMRERLPEFARNPPSGWALLNVIEGGYDFYSPKIYYVPA